MDKATGAISRYGQLSPCVIGDSLFSFLFFFFFFFFFFAFFLGFWAFLSAFRPARSDGNDQRGRPSFLFSLPIPSRLLSALSHWLTSPSQAAFHIWRYTMETGSLITSSPSFPPPPPSLLQPISIPLASFLFDWLEMKQRCGNCGCKYASFVGGVGSVGSVGSVDLIPALRVLNGSCGNPGLSFPLGEERMAFPPWLCLSVASPLLPLSPYFTGGDWISDGILIQLLPAKQPR